MNNFFKTVFAILCLFFLVSCNSQEEVIPEDLYKNLFTELALLNQVNDEYLSDSERDSLRKEIFSHYNITEEKFRISHNFYESQNEQQIARMDSINHRLRNLRDEIDLAQREYKEMVDSLRQVEDGVEFEEEEEDDDDDEAGVDSDSDPDGVAEEDNR